MSRQPDGIRPHHRLAEEALDLAAKGRHFEALLKFREAARQASSAGAHEITLRYYFECVLESLELIDRLDEVVELCDKAMAQPRKTDDPIALKERAHFLQKKGLALLKGGDASAGKVALEEAMKLADTLGMRLSPTDRILRWLRRGCRVEPHRILEEQLSAGYFSTFPAGGKPTSWRHAEAQQTEETIEGRYRDAR